LPVWAQAAVARGANNEADSVFTFVFPIRAPFYSRGFLCVIQEVTARMKGSANVFSSAHESIPFTQNEIRSQKRCGTELNAYVFARHFS
jgi:hypothetical protein